MSDFTTDTLPDGHGLADLIAAARNGSKSALARLIELYRGQLRARAKRTFPLDLQSKEGASDLVQESCLAAHEGFAQFEGRTREEFENWLEKILQNKLAHLIRRYRDTSKRAAGREVPMPSSGGDWPAAENSSISPSRRVVKQEELQQLQQALRRLPEQHRQVIQWWQQERMTWEEIAQRMGRSTDAVRKLWSRAIDNLRRKMRKSSADQ